MDFPGLWGGDSIVTPACYARHAMAQSRVKAAPRRPMLLFWGVLTALVIICAYVIALALAAGCAYIGYALLGSGSVSVVLLILAVGAITCAAAILWSLAPRPDKF